MRRLLVVGLLMAGVTVFFGGRFGAGLARMAGERAYLSGDFVKAWALYGRAASFGSDRVQIETDKAELLLFGLDQQNIGVKLDLPLDEDEVLDSARILVSSLLTAAPHRAYFWSLASDLYLHEALEHRRSTPIDLSALSDDPRENLLPEEILAAAAMAEAARREPRNYFYDDLLAEQYFQWGLTEMAMPVVRRSVALYPVLDGHIYLTRPRLEDEIVEATVAGLDDALQMRSMISTDGIELAIGRFLARQGRHEQAIAHLRRAMDLNPGALDPPYQLGISSYYIGDFASTVTYLTLATKMLPELADGWYYLGLAESKLGEKRKAIEAFRRAREEDPDRVKFFHALADHLEADGETKESERQFQAAANLNKDSVPAWLALLGFYERHPDLAAEGRRLCSRLVSTQVPQTLYEERCAAIARRGR